MTDQPVRRSQATRDRILEAARSLFATQGYESTTLRQIAALAETNVALAIRYFESKESLFALAADFNLRLPPLQELARARLGRLLVSHFLAIWEDDRAGRELVALLRAASSHAAARARIHAIFHDQLLTAVRGMGYEAAEADTRAGLVASQMLGLATVRYVLELGTGTLSRDATVRIVGATIQRYLVGPL
ncbi:TetR family transcriptional regulator [Massilia sp. IC2-477]|uniref:TetR/AcrR family transcriptional regulator n=1 Tax=Massilia sp. IC2-477 TaxID=2887198 RepID=UPI001D0FE4B3|nr:TetR family transcriptional regulator [Massilia sp. IC2-477]MCC2957842.1 TetR family transcriptional regulator [Massilia sp. IC2-477]